jgi:hypothetical protein
VHKLTSPVSTYIVCLLSTQLLICGNPNPKFDELEHAATYDGWNFLHPFGFMHPPGPTQRGQPPPSVPVIGHFWNFFHGQTANQHVLTAICFPCFPSTSMLLTLLAASSPPGLSVELKKRLLAFVTGSNRVPIKGLRHANFVIVHGGEDERKLPESHTCFKSVGTAESNALTAMKARCVKLVANCLRSLPYHPPFCLSSQLVLPNYKSAATLREKMLLAINEGAEGFALR